MQPRFQSPFLKSFPGICVSPLPSCSPCKVPTLISSSTWLWLQKDTQLYWLVLLRWLWTSTESSAQVSNPVSVLQNQLCCTSFSKLQCSYLGLWPYFLVCWENKHQKEFLLALYPSLCFPSHLQELFNYPVILQHHRFPSLPDDHFHQQIYYLPSANDSFMSKTP